MASGKPDRMPDFAFRMMRGVMSLTDLLSHRLDKRVAAFDIFVGMTIVDYGCGPGRYTVKFARLVGSSGKVYAIDVHEMAIETVKRKMAEQGLQNIIPVLAHGYTTDIGDHTADMVFALDMFFMVKDPVALLEELHRIVRADGVLVLDDGHESRQETLNKINRSDRWTIMEQNRDHLRLRPEKSREHSAVA